MKYEEHKKAYFEISEVCGKYLDLSKTEYCYSDIKDMKNKADNHLKLIEWYELYNIDIPHDRGIIGYNYFKINDNQFFNYYSDAKQERENGSGKYISWSDDDKQPMNEWLYVINFPTGAYIFGDDYPTELFYELFTELKGYNPDYSDTNNKGLYFKLENASKVYNEFPNIMKKYHEKNNEDRKVRKANKLRKELEELEKTS